jgi:hypothetical protein
MKADIDTFETLGGFKVILASDSRGIFFTILTVNGQIGDAYQIGMSWSSLRQMLRDLGYGKKYIIKDRSLHAWIKDNQLHLLFRSLDIPVSNEVVLSAEETQRLVEYLNSALHK